MLYQLSHLPEHHQDKQNRDHLSMSLGAGQGFVSVLRHIVSPVASPHS